MKAQSLNVFNPSKTGTLLVMVLIFTLFSFSGNIPAMDDVIRLNPDCKVKRMSNGSVIVSSKNMEGIEEKHQFTDFYADLLMAAYRKQKTDFVLSSFSKKYYLTREECRREMKHALNVLTEWNIIQREDRVANR